jgi:hypothetical protein
MHRPFLALHGTKYYSLTKSQGLEQLTSLDSGILSLKSFTHYVKSRYEEKLSFSRLYVPIWS